MYRLAREVFFAALADTSAPLEYQSVADWAEQHRHLPRRTSRITGRWRNSRTPYLIEPMNCMSLRSDVVEVVCRKGTQLGFTEAGFNCVGYWLHHGAASMMITYPTIGLAKTTSKIRFESLINNTACLSNMIKPSNKRDPNNTILEKHFAGGSAILNGANSPVGFRSYTFRFGMGDEISAWPSDVAGEGDPVDLMRRGQQTYGESAKLWLVSSPSTEGECGITILYNLSDRRHFFVPCPACGHRQQLLWSQMRWENDDPDTVYHECEKCKYHILNQHKAAILPRGEWVPERTGQYNRHGYQLSALYSPPGWKSWANGVRQYLDIRGIVEKRKVFSNHYLGVPWRPEGVEVQEAVLRSHAAGYLSGQVPSDVHLLTAGVDVQGIRGGYLAVEIVGWAPRMQSWSISYRELPGGTSTPESAAWQRLEELMATEFVTMDGRRLQIAMACVDSGWQTATVLDWMARNNWCDGRATAIRGQAGWRRPPVSHSESRVEGHDKVPFWNVGVDILKEQVASWLKSSPTEYGHSQFPSDATDKYFESLTAERLVTTRSRFGRVRRSWQVRHGVRRNEALDCRVYATAAVTLLGATGWGDDDWARQRLA